LITTDQVAKREAFAAHQVAHDKRQTDKKNKELNGRQDALDERPRRGVASGALGWGVELG
jgi:hypothetical protein